MDKATTPLHKGGKANGIAKLVFLAAVAAVVLPAGAAAANVPSSLAVGVNTVSLYQERRSVPSTCVPLRNDWECVKGKKSIARFHFLTPVSFMCQVSVKVVQQCV
jgi:hypothetical protein